MPRFAVLAVVPLALLSACQSSDGPLSLLQQDLMLGYAGSSSQLDGPRRSLDPALETSSNGRATIRPGVTAATDGEAVESPGVESTNPLASKPKSNGIYTVDMSSISPPQDEVARLNAQIEHAMAEHRDLPALPVARRIEIQSVRTALKNSVEIPGTPPQSFDTELAPQPSATAPSAL